MRRFTPGAHRTRRALYIHNMVPRLSICVPAYNGGEQLGVLLDGLFSSDRRDFEVVISDDNSGDGSWELVQARASVEPRLRCFRNPQNLGMDRNFARVASLARGQYLWFTGQDDCIQAEGLFRVLEFLAARPDIDFILMNHAKRVSGRFGEYMVEADKMADHVFGVGLESYLNHTRHHLPTFLPTFLMRTSMWRSVDISRYFGTCYCQVGVFLESSESIRWCHFAGNHVIGLLPPDGWQTNPTSFVRIAFGYFAMLARALKRTPWMTVDMLEVLFRDQKRRLVYSFMLIRHYNVAVSSDLIDEVVTAVQPFRGISMAASLVRRSPSFLSSISLLLISIRRAVRFFLKVRLARR